MRHKPLSWCYYQGIFWFRIFGWGLHIRPKKGYVPLFSERYGYTKPLYIGPLRIELLKGTRA